MKNSLLILITCFTLVTLSACIEDRHSHGDGSHSHDHEQKHHQDSID